MINKLISEIQKVLEKGEFAPKKDIFSKDFVHVDKEKKVCSICINGFIWFNFDEILFNNNDADLIMNINNTWCGNINGIREKEIEITDIFKNNIHVTIK